MEYRNSNLDLTQYVAVAPYWNVNKALNLYTCHQTIVAVAPYWNVNVLIIIGVIAALVVAVAPYWNVNSYKIHFQLNT